MSKYGPVVTRLDDGTIVEVSQEQVRQRDASAALAELSDRKAAKVLRVQDGDDLVAEVYRTGRLDELRYVVRIKSARRITRDLHALNVATGRVGDDRITSAGVPLVDPLDAPDDRALEASTRGGLVRLDRRKLLERIGLGQAQASLDEVVHQD